MSGRRVAGGSGSMGVVTCRRAEDVSPQENPNEYKPD